MEQLGTEPIVLVLSAATTERDAVATVARKAPR